MQKNKNMVELGRKGGIARAQKLSKEMRSESARHAVMSLSKRQRILNAKKANKASHLAKKRKKLAVHN